jgi:hypothetical protein
MLCFCVNCYDEGLCSMGFLNRMVYLLSMICISYKIDVSNMVGNYCELMKVTHQIIILLEKILELRVLVKLKIHYWRFL